MSVEPGGFVADLLAQLVGSAIGTVGALSWWREQGLPLAAATECRCVCEASPATADPSAPVWILGLVIGINFLSFVLGALLGALCCRGRGRALDAGRSVPRGPVVVRGHGIFGGQDALTDGRGAPARA